VLLIKVELNNVVTHEIACSGFSRS